MEVFYKVGKLYLNIKIKQLLKEKGISQKELAERTGLREATISELANNRRDVINKQHLLLIMEELNIDDLNDIVEVIKI